MPTTKEVKPEGADTNPNFEIFSASEVGNIFPLGVEVYQGKRIRIHRQEWKQKKPIFMGSYGIGISRLMGVLVEKIS